MPDEPINWKRKIILENLGYCKQFVEYPEVFTDWEVDFILGLLERTGDGDKPLESISAKEFNKLQQITMDLPNRLGRVWRESRRY